MLERLRALPLPFRLTLYVASAILLFFLAVGLGVAAGSVVSRQFEPSSLVTVWTGVSGGGKPETSETVRKPGNTTNETTDSAVSDGTVHDTSFVHHATDENSRGDYTYIDDPSIDGDANAIVLVKTTPDRDSSASAASYEHNVGVWYEPVARKWAIFNQDRAAMTVGTTFEVNVPQAPAAFVHHARLLNTAGSYTYIDNKLTNGEPGAVLSVTQNWNPGGGGGIYNDHRVGTQYDANLDKWAIYNRDGAPMPQGAAFNFAVSANKGTR